VVGDADVDELTGGEQGVLAGLKPGSVIAVHSTVHPNTCNELAKKAAAHDVSVIDAPVSGGGGAATEGRLLVMVGGDADVVERCKPVFETYADPVVYVGELGSGQTTKLLNNLLFTANLATAATTLTLGQALGVSPEGLTEVISRGSGNSFALNALGGVGGLDRLAGYAGSLLQKDVRLVADLAERASASPGAVLDAADAALTLMKHPR
jgi:3-hydroxyisobutyrate dehydrogenase-like beta-hydroxyacid dehydrogenase